jgi:hypothetical protein
MKYDQITSGCGNRYRITFLFIFLLLMTRLSLSQQIPTDSLTPHLNKNAIKGMPILLPFVGVAVYTGLSIGYERYISKHHGLELCSYYYFNLDEMGAQFHNFSIMPGYKYFTKSEKERYNNFWAGVYLSYYQEYQTVSDGDGGSARQYCYGIGVSVGKKINLSKNKRLFLDLGFGVAFSKWLKEPLLSDTEWEDKYINNRILPRPVLQFGWKF